MLYSRPSESRTCSADSPCRFVFFFSETATTEIYTLSLHDALPISVARVTPERERLDHDVEPGIPASEDRKSTRLNSSHMSISYAVFCLKKKNTPLTQVSTLRPLHTSNPSGLRLSRKLSSTSRSCLL